MSNVAEKLFGTVKSTKIKAVGNYEVDIEKIKKDFESPNAVAKVFCKGCGTTFEISQNQTNLLCEKANFEKPEGKFFFHTEGCDFCDGDITKITIIKL